MFVHLFAWWCCGNLYVHYVFPMVMFFISGRQIKTGAFDKKHPERPRANSWGFGVQDTKDPSLATLKLKKKYWWHTKELKLPQKGSIRKHSSS